MYYVALDARSGGFLSLPTTLGSRTAEAGSSIILLAGKRRPGEPFSECVRPGVQSSFRSNFQPCPTCGKSGQKDPQKEWGSYP